MSASDKSCGARFFPANGETVTPCELPAGHDGDEHQGWCLGSPCRWTGGSVETEAYVSGWENTPLPAPWNLGCDEAKPQSSPVSLCGCSFGEQCSGCTGGPLW